MHHSSPQSKHFSGSNESKNSSLSKDDSKNKSKTQNADAHGVTKQIVRNPLMSIVTFLTMFLALLNKLRSLEEHALRQILITRNSKIKLKYELQLETIPTLMQCYEKHDPEEVHEVDTVLQLFYGRND